jgi:hypothetical protein
MDLDQMEPGPFLAAILDHTDVDRLSGHDRVVALRVCRRVASHYQAQTLQAMASISDLMRDLDDDFELAHRSAATEIRTALTLTRRAAEAELDLAIDTRQRLPQVWEALSRDDIDARKAHVIATTTCHLNEDVAQSLAERTVARAPMLTTGQLRADIAKLCLEANPTGTADLRGTNLPPDRAVAISRMALAAVILPHLLRHRLSSRVLPSSCGDTARHQLVVPSPSLPTIERSGSIEVTSKPISGIIRILSPISRFWYLGMMASALGWPSLSIQS